MEQLLLEASLLSPLFWFCYVCGVITMILLIILFLEVFNPPAFISIVKDTKELKLLAQETKKELEHSGFITKLFFRIFSKGAERYF